MHPEDQLLRMYTRGWGSTPASNPVLPPCQACTISISDITSFTANNARSNPTTDTRQSSVSANAKDPLLCLPKWSATYPTLHASYFRAVDY